MASLPSPVPPTNSPEMRDLKWSQAEKNIARKAFDLALQQEFKKAIQKTKELAENIEEPQDLWNIEEYLTNCRKSIDRQYDYRYSVLPMVFGILIREGKLSEKDLTGLGEDKLRFIRGYSTEHL